MEKMQNNFNISIIHPTCRPGIARETREKWLDLASKPDLVEYLLCIDSDNNNSPKTSIIKENSKEFFYPLINGESVGPVQKSNFAAQNSSSNCILFAADDLSPNKNWDYDIHNCTNWDNDVVLRIPDNTEETQQRLHPYLIVNPAISRKRYEKFGYFYHPKFYATFSDNFFSFLAHKDDIVIHNEEIVFYHDQSKYIKQGNDNPLERNLDKFQLKMHCAENYNKGYNTFLELIPHHITENEINNLSEEYLFANEKRKKNILFVLNSVNLKGKKS